MAKAIEPSPGITDELGTQTNPFDVSFIRTIKDANGNLYAVIPIDASAIQSGNFNPNLINKLNPGVIVLAIPNITLAQIIANAALGASDPAARINSGTTLLDGGKIRAATLSPNAINPTVPFTGLFLFGTGGTLETAGYPNIPGFFISPTTFVVTLPNAVFRGIVEGTINIAGLFQVDNSGNAIWGDPGSNPELVHGANNDGSEFWGSDNFADAPAAFDQYGNFFLSDSPNSRSFIDPGAIALINRGVLASPGGGQFTGNVTLTAKTRGSQMFYTTDGSDPSVITNANRILYTAPIAVAPTTGNPVTIKACGQKFGVTSPVSTFIYTAAPDAQTCALPEFNPIPGFYTSQTGLQSVALSDGTPGATITYTTDGSTPGPTNGTIYVNPFNIGPGPVTVKSIASKAGIASSAIAVGNYDITRGGGQQHGSGGGHNPPP